MDPKYPDITVPLIGEDGNIFVIMGRARRVAKRGGVPKEEIEEFSKEVMATGSYQDALTVVQNWFDVE